MFQIGHVSLTSADTYRRDSYCLARVFQNLPAPPKQYGVFDVFCGFQSFFQLENLGVALGNVPRWQIFTARLTNSSRNLPSAIHALFEKLNEKNIEKSDKLQNKIQLSATEKFKPLYRGAVYCSRVEARYNEPLYDEFLDVTNHFLYPSYSKIYGKESR